MKEIIRFPTKNGAEYAPFLRFQQVLFALVLIAMQFHVVRLHGTPYEGGIDDGENMPVSSPRLQSVFLSNRTGWIRSDSLKHRIRVSRKLTPPGDKRYKLTMQIGHSGGVSSVHFSPDGSQVLSSSWDNTLKLWDVTSGRLIRTFDGHSNQITSAAFSPNGRQILASSWDDKLKLWDVSTGQLIRTFDQHLTQITSVAISPDGRQALSGSSVWGSLFIAGLNLWDVATGKLIRKFEGHTAQVNSVAFSPNGQQAVSGGDDTTLKLWDTATGRIIRSFEGYSSLVRSVAFSADGRLVLSGSADTTKCPHAICDSKLGRADNTLKLWDVATGRLIRIFEGHSNWVDSVAFSPDGHLALSASVDKTIKLWDVATGQVIRSFEGHEGTVSAAVFSPDGHQVLSGSDDKTVKLWDVATGRLIHTFGGHSNSVGSTAFSPDGRQALAGSSDHTVQLWDVATGRLIRTFEGHSSWVGSVAFSPDGHQALSASADKTIKLWDVATGQVIRSFEGHEGTVSAAVFSSDGHQVLSGSWDNTIKLWDVATGRIIRSFGGHTAGVLSVALSSDGRLALSGSWDQTLRLWDVKSGGLLHIFPKHHLGWVTSVAFSPDGHQILSGNTNKTMELWDTATGRLIRSFEGHSDQITSVAFSPDGHFVFSGGRDATLRLWDVATGMLIHTLEGHLAEVKSVAFSPDGLTGMSSSADGTINLWRVTTGQLLASLVGTTTDKWIILTSAGFFNVGAQGTNLIHIVRDSDVVQVGQIVEHLYRPDLVEHLLMGDSEGRYRNAAYKLNLKEILDSGPAPQIEFLEQKTELADDTVRLSVRIVGRGGGVGERIRWRVNGVTQGDPTPIELDSLLSPLASVVVTQTLKLASGQKNIVEVTAYSKSSLLATLPLKITIDKLGATSKRRPRMFTLTLGVDIYRSNEYRLNYAASDAKSISRAFEVVGGGLFSEIESKILTDYDVKYEKISKAIDEIAKEIRPEDVFILFLGGHGKSIEGRYYYYPQGLDFSTGQTVENDAIGQDKWEKWLAKLVAQKSLIIIDTCEGDAFRGVRGADDIRQAAMTQLQHATGRNIIAAARDAAYEGYRGHGVLTYALLEALDSKISTNIRNVDTPIRISSLAEYISKRVPEISQRNFGIYQNPTLKLLGNDFPIGIRQAVLNLETNVSVIPAEPTHVIIQETILREQPDKNVDGSRTLPYGFQVRVLKFSGEWALIAREGQKIGYIPTKVLLRLQ